MIIKVDGYMINSRLLERSEEAKQTEKKWVWPKYAIVEDDKLEWKNKLEWNAASPPFWDLFIHQSLVIKTSVKST